MTLQDLKEHLDVSDTDLDKYLLSLEEKDLAGLYRDKNGVVKLARATLVGIAKAYPKDHYKYIPPWVNKEDLF